MRAVHAVEAVRNVILERVALDKCGGEETVSPVRRTMLSTLIMWVP